MIRSPSFAAFLLALSISTAVPALAQESAAPATETIDAGSNASLLVPEGWTVVRDGGTVAITAPEGDATIALVAIPSAANGEEAVAQAWARFDPAFDRVVRLAVDQRHPRHLQVRGRERGAEVRKVLRGIGGGR